MKRNLYKYGVIGLLSALVLFWSYIFLAAINGYSPKGFFQEITTSSSDIDQLSKNNPGDVIDLTIQMPDIFPSDNSKESLSKEDNRVSITFPQEMDTTYNEVVDWSLYTDQEELSWDDSFWLDEQNYILSV